MKEYIRLEEEKVHRLVKVYNWETAKYGKIGYGEDVHDLKSVETKFPAIVLNDELTSEEALTCEPTVSGSENRPRMLNKENYVPWSSRLLRYAKSRPNGKLIHNSIINGPYVRRMIPEPGDPNREVPVNETFHVQTDDELTKKELKLIEADDQAIQTILLCLPEDIYAAVDSCETAQEICIQAKLLNTNQQQPEDFIKPNPHNRKIAQSGMNMGQDRQMQMVGGNGRNQFRLYAGQNVGNLNGYNDVQNVRNQVIQHAVPNPRIQNVGNQNGLIGVLGNANQNPNENGNLAAAHAEVRPRRRDASYLQTQLLIAQKEKAGIQLQAEEFDLMATIADLDEIEEYTELLEPIPEPHQVPQNDNNVISDVSSVEQTGGTVEQHPVNVEKIQATKFVEDFKSLAKKADESLAKHKALELEIECLLRAVVSQDIMSVVQNNSVVETSNLQTELECTKERFENCIIKKENEYAKLWNDWYKKCKECKYDKISYDKAYNDMQQKIERLQAQLGDLKGKSKDTSCVSDTLNPLSSKLENENVELEFQLKAQLSDKVSDHKDTTSGKSVNTKFLKQSILGKPPKVGEIHALSKPVTSNSISTPQGSKVVKNDKKQKENASINEKQKKQQPKVKKTKKVGSIERLASPKPSKPRSVLRVYFVEGLGHNLFSVGQFCDSDLEIAFRKNACFVRNLEGVDLLKGNRSTNLYTINLHEMASVSPICLMARASSTKSWFWHQRLSHLNFDTINDLAKNDLVSGLPKFKYHKEHLCPLREQGKSKRASHPPKPVPNSRQRLNLLHMDLCGPMRITSINGKRYVLVIVDDYSRYTWVHFLRSKDEAPETLVEPARTMLIFSRAPLFLWAEAIATACFTQNRFIIHRRFNKTPYELINGKKPDISFLYVFEALCYPKNDREDIRKLGEKGDIGFFIGYSADSCAYRVYNRRTKKIMETMNVSFDELSAMAFEQRTLKPELQSMTFRQISSGLDLTYAPSTITTQQPTEGELDLLFEAMYDDYIGGQPSAALRTVPAAQAHQATIQPKTVTENVLNAMFDVNTFVNPFATPSTSAAESSSLQYVDPSNMHKFYQPYPHEFQWTKDHPLERVIGEPSGPVLTRNQLRSDGDMCMYALTVSAMEPKNAKEAMTDPTWIESMQEELLQFKRLDNAKEAMTDPAWIESMQEELLQFKRLDVWLLVPTPDNITSLTLKWLFKNKHDEEQMVIRNKSRLVVRGYRQGEGIDFEESFAPVYADDIIFGSTHPRYTQLFFDLMKSRFEMSMIGEMMVFLGLQVNQSPCGIFINQSDYVLEILKKYEMKSCDSVGTPMEIKDKLDLDQNGTPVDGSKYHSMIGSIMYLSSSRPDIVHATCLCARYQAKPIEKHLNFELTGFSDADYAGCKDTFKSTSGRAQFLGEKLPNYVLEILKKYEMESCDPVDTPMEIKDKLDLDQNGFLVDATKYRSMIGALMYLTSSRSDIVHATCLCAQYQAKTTEKHLKEVKRIFCYLRGTINIGLWYTKDSGFELTGFSYADYAGCKDTFNSTFGGAQFLGKKLVSWSSKKQDCTTLSTTEAEYVSLSACCAQVLWMRTQLTDYGFHFDKIPIYYDSKSAIAISCNPVQHSRTKHIIVRFHFIKEHVEKGTIEMYFVKTDYQLAEIFTKALPTDRFNYLVRRLGMRSLSPKELERLAKSL
nr:retrovirus-related Pol polyprotein from transposon TNT 1-94 [Tanacetum cinerariifolium]